MLTTGVATVTPVYNAQDLQRQNEEITTNYTENVDINSNAIYTESNQTTINNINSNYQYGYIQDWRYSVAKTSTYINVIGNIYKSYVYKPAEDTNENVDVMYVQNKKVFDETENTVEKTTRLIYCLQLTPYNININTEVDIGITIDFSNLIPTGLGNVIVDEIYMRRETFITSSENWAYYLGLQLTTNIVKTIDNEIKDPNSNYYYTYNDSTIECTEEVEEYSQFEDNLQFTISPKVTNYLFIEYTPMIKAIKYQTNGDPGEYTADNVMCAEGQIGPQNRLIISGTNIIANGTYEVIDLPGLMWQILEMPFAFVSQAFNLTLFPGTPYQVNIANLFLAIIAMFVFVWLIGLLLKLKG